MDTWTFGWTLALIGMGGTMLVLWLISLMILLIRKIFPHQAEPSAAKKG
jgi:Oxaloacetate decarboxylase, gamma chain